MDAPPPPLLPLHLPAPARPAPQRPSPKCATLGSKRKGCLHCSARSNDNWAPLSGDSEKRRCFERMVRKLLKYPRQPAVVLLNTYAYIKQGGR